MSEAQLQRLEKESERFAKEIKQKEAENERLREQITALQEQVSASKASFWPTAPRSLPGLLS